MTMFTTESPLVVDADIGGLSATADDDLDRDIDIGDPSDAHGSPIHAEPLNQTDIFEWVKGDIIGRGIYGKVFRAMIVKTGEMIAVKQVEFPKLASDGANSRQLLRVEVLTSGIDTLGTLDHINVVEYLGTEVTSEHLNIFMEYVPGGSIASCVQNFGKFGENVVKSFTRQILTGLEYLHGMGIVHRDLNSENILVDPQGICKISSFGTSKRINDGGGYMPDDVVNQSQSDVYWMAPEVVSNFGKSCTAKVDIWSVGCIWQEICTGERPWNNEIAFHVILQLGRQQKAPPFPENCVLSELAYSFRQSCFVISQTDRPTATFLLSHSYLTLPPDWEFHGLMD